MIGCRCTCTFISNNKSLQLVGYKILIYFIAGMLDSFLNLSRDLHTAVRSYIQPLEIVYSGQKLFTAVYN